MNHRDADFREYLLLRAAGSEDLGHLEVVVVLVETHDF